MTYQEYLRTQFLDRKQTNARYSLRAFAKLIGLNPGTLSRIFSGNGELSLDRANEICTKLKLGPKETRLFLSLVQLGRTTQVQVREALMQDLSDVLPEGFMDVSVEEFHLVSNWIAFAVFRMLGLPKKWNVSLLAKSLNVSSSEIQQVLDRMARLKWVAVEKGEIKRIANHFRIESKVKNEALTELYTQFFDKAKSNLDLEESDTRSIGAAALCFEQKNMKQVQQLTKDFLDSLEKISRSAGSAEAVTYLTIVDTFQVNPLKRRKSNHGNA